MDIVKDCLDLGHGSICRENCINLGKKLRRTLKFPRDQIHSLAFWRTLGYSRIFVGKLNKTKNNAFSVFQEEIQKLAGQIEYLKIVGMLIENPHIRSKKDGYFSKENCTKQLNQSLKKVYSDSNLYSPQNWFNLLHANYLQIT